MNNASPFELRLLRLKFPAATAAKPQFQDSVAPRCNMSGEAETLKGENARMSSFVGAIAIADLVKTTLGPKGNSSFKHLIPFPRLTV